MTPQRSDELAVNPITAPDLMSARVARPRSQADRAATGRATCTALWRIRRWAVGLAAAALMLLAGAPAALAVPLPPPGGATGAQAALPPPFPGAAGTPGWQIVLIAIGSALLASALTLLAVRAARRAAPARPSPS
jgi:hypothetical protein